MSFRRGSVPSRLWEWGLERLVESIAGDGSIPASGAPRLAATALDIGT